MSLAELTKERKFDPLSILSKGLNGEILGGLLMGTISLIIPKTNLLKIQEDRCPFVYCPGGPLCYKCPKPYDVSRSSRPYFGRKPSMHHVKPWEMLGQGPPDDPGNTERDIVFIDTGGGCVVYGGYSSDVDGGCEISGGDVGYSGGYVGY